MSTIWSVPPNELELLAEDVHVWRVGLNLKDSQLDRLFLFLSDDERARAKRFHFEEDRLRYIGSHGVLRTVLAYYQQTTPEEIRFCYSPEGKPALVPQSGKYQLSFNLSRSSDLALIAITIDRRVGADLERINGNVEIEQLAERFFATQELAALRALSPALKQEAFFNCWTRKEAYVKALGGGLSLPLDQFEVSFLSGEPVELKKSLPNVGTQPWYIEDIDPGPGFKGAVAAEGFDLRFSCWQWTEKFLQA